MRIGAVILLLCLVAPVLSADKGGGGHDSNEILLKLAPGVLIETINARYNTETDDVILGGTVYKVEVQDDSTLDATVAAMEKDKDILQVEFNYFGETPEAVRRTIAVIDGTPSSTKYHDQDAFIRMKGPEAQTVSTGQNVVVAVIDTGVDYNHPDLTNHVVRDNQNQVVGYNFIDNNSDPMDSRNGIDDNGNGLIDEGAGHGTHIAGIIALVAPDAKILPLRVLNSDGVGTADLVAQAIDFAVNYAHHNHDVSMVINLSLVLTAESFALDESIQEALGDGIPVIASAGNDNSSAQHFPAAFNIPPYEVVAVAATD
ncbi:MAG TPA: S8 family serine peptidase, partial [Acidobacteriota bacterium]|nr:S8 family serine peptidase [Acidobacteriota bacterium]